MVILGTIVGLIVGIILGLFILSWIFLSVARKDPERIIALLDKIKEEFNTSD